MSHPPKPRSVKAVIKVNGTTIGEIDGEAKPSLRGGVIVTGTNTDDLDERPAQVHFPDWTMRGPGQPKRSEVTNVSYILRSEIAMRKYDTDWSHAISLAGINERTAARAKAAIRKSGRIRKVFSYLLDGRWTAVAYLNDGMHRPNDQSGPAWVLQDGETNAQLFNNLVF